MGRTCDMCGRGTTVGLNVPRKGVPKKKGGVGIRKGPQTKRTFLINLHPKRVTVNGRTRRMRLCSKCLRTLDLQKV